jgi:hypothetical protein
LHFATPLFEPANYGARDFWNRCEVSRLASLPGPQVAPLCQPTMEATRPQLRAGRLPGHAYWYKTPKTCNNQNLSFSLTLY